MEQLALHIEYLLQRHDCVILPGLGAFIAVNKAAHFDEESKRFFPPYREICFNASIRNDDGMIANSFKRKMNVSYDEGRRIVSAEIDVLNNILSTDGEVSIGKIGILSISHEGIIEFRPMISGQKITEDMGLSPVETIQSSYQTERNISQGFSNTDLHYCVSQPTREVVEEETTSSATQSIKPNSFYIRINKTFAKVAACLIVILIIGIGFGIKSPMVKSVSQQASVIPIESLSVKTISEKNEQGVPSKEQNEQISEEPTHVELQHEEPTHYLIVGTFNTIEEAEKFIKSQSDNYPLQLIEGKRVCRVSVASANDSEKLFAMMKDEDFKAQHPTAWVWTRNLQK